MENLWAHWTWRHFDSNKACKLSSHLCVVRWHEGMRRTRLSLCLSSSGLWGPNHWWRSNLDRWTFLSPSSLIKVEILILLVEWQVLSKVWLFVWFFFLFFLFYLKLGKKERKETRRREASGYPRVMEVATRRRWKEPGESKQAARGSEGRACFHHFPASITDGDFVRSAGRGNVWSLQSALAMGVSENN